MASRDEKISKLEDQIKFKKDSLKKLPGQAQIKNAQIALLGREAANPSTSSEDPKNINIEKSKAKASKNAEKDQKRAQVDDILKNQIPNLKKEIEFLEKELNNLRSQPETEELQKNENINKKMAKLTKNDIRKMVENAEPARMTKMELIESIQRQLLREDISDDVIRQLDSGEHSYKGHLNPETVKNISQKMIQQVSNDLSSKMGGTRPSLRTATNALQQGLFGAIQKEEGHRRELERLAVKMVRDEYEIPEGVIDFDVEITGERPVAVGNIPLRSTNKPVPQGKTEEELKPKVTKRKLENALIQGAGRAGQNMFYMASDELNRINPTLIQDYAKLMAANNYMYWALNDQQIMDASGQKAGEFKISFREETPKIIAKGMTFSLLLHELNKAVVEYLSVDSQDPDRSVRDYVKDRTDNLEEETWDIRLGQLIWQKLLDSLGVDALNYKSFILTRIFDLPESQFNKVIEGVLNDDEESIEFVKNIAYDVIKMKNNDAVEDALSQFRDEDEEEDEEEDEDTLAGGGKEKEDELLKNLLSKQEKEDPNDPMNWGLKKLEAERDIALDNGDYKKVAYIQTIMDTKFPGN